MLTRGMCVLLMGSALLIGQSALAGGPGEKTAKKGAAPAAEKAVPKTLVAPEASKTDAGAKPAVKGASQSASPASSVPNTESPKKAKALEGKRGERPSKTPRPREAVKQSTSQPLAVGAEAIRSALAKPIQLEFVETPLSTVVDYLKDVLHIPVVLDHKSLDDVGVSPDTPITRNLRGVSARSALNLVLDDLDLTWAISNEVLLITTPEKVDSMLENVVYEVHDLVAARDEKGEPVNDFDQLIDVITSTVLPTTWDSVGGPGSIAPFEGNGIAALSISQTQHVHEQITKFLADLRKATHSKPGEPLYIRTVRPPKSGAPGKCYGNPGPGKPADVQPTPGSQPTPNTEQPKATGRGMGGGGTF